MSLSLRRFNIARPRHKRILTGTFSRGAIVALGFITIVTATACGTSGTGSTKSSASAATGVSYFKGKTITVVITTAPGGGNAAVLTAAQPFLEKYLGATVNLTYNTAGGGYGGQDYVAAAKPDGLTIGLLSFTADLQAADQKQPNVDFNIKHIRIIAGWATGIQVLVACAGSPVKSAQQIFSSSDQITAVTYPGTQNLDEHLLFAAYGVNAKYISAYASSVESATGCLRGDGKVGLAVLTDFASAITAGKVRPLAVSVPVPSNFPAYAQLKSTPTFSSFLQSEPPTSALGKSALQLLIGVNGTTSTTASTAMFAPAGTPTSVVATLLKAFQYAFKQAPLHAAELKAGQPVTLYGSGQIVAQMNKWTAPADVKLMQESGALTG